MLSQKTIDIVKSTVPVLEIHGETITKTFYKNLFEAHPELLNIFNQTNQKRGRQQTALANTVLAAAKYIDNLGVIVPVVKQIAHKHRSLAVKPEHYPIVGENLLKAIKEVLGDAATDEIINAWAEAYGVIADAFIGIEKDMYKEASEQNNGWEDYKEFRVTDKVQESDLITSFYLRPTDGTKVPAYLPGQYITIRVNIPEEQYLCNRQYSLSVAPGHDYFRISVKKEAEGGEHEGKVSNYLHKSVQIGDKIEVTAPAGDFILEEKDTPIVFLAGGVGITPLLSMVQTVSEKQPNRSVQFIQAANNGSVQAFRNELSEIKLADYELGFVYTSPTDIDKNNPYFVKEGYVDRDVLAETIKPDADYYVCGPVPFMKSVIATLKELGVTEEKIHFEFFGPAMAL
ncbi:NO-inducible flavohemoprotein [Peribacillus sp. Hz7]|uniref:NO-inducible flavohemoprotein n=1 Tax=Peribacillus sp. Hz7 TaxID=3344873 RepID=UPI0035C94B1A